MSEVKVNKISPRSGTTVTLGDSGDTITLASGVSLTGVNATFSGDLTVDTSTLKVDSTNNRVGIGTNSPSTALEVAGTIKSTVTDNSAGLILECTDDDALQGPQIQLKRNSATPADGDVLGQILFGGVNDNVPEGHVYAKIQSKIQDASNATEDGILDIQTTVATSEGTSRIYIDSTEVVINDESIDSDFRVESNGNTHMLFVDANSNAVLFGKNTIGAGMDSAVGAGIFADGRVFGTSTSYAGQFVRRDSDGSILNFKKDTTDVGSISVSGTNFIVSGSGTVSGVRFNSNGMLPVVGGNLSDNTEDLGQNNYRWKDAYIGGNIYLGGTGSANALDDYEEGTWTPSYVPLSGSFTSITYDTQAGTYTKVGNLVQLAFKLETDAITVGTASGALKIGGLPFLPVSSSNRGVNAVYRGSWATTDAPQFVITSSNSTEMFLSLPIGATVRNTEVDDMATGANDNELIGCVVYQTNA